MNIFSIFYKCTLKTLPILKNEPTNLTNLAFDLCQVASKTNVRRNFNKLRECGRCYNHNSEKESGRFEITVLHYSVSCLSFVLTLFYLFNILVKEVNNTI